MILCVPLIFFSPSTCGHTYPIHTPPTSFSIILRESPEAYQFIHKYFSLYV